MAGIEAGLAELAAHDVDVESCLLGLDDIDDVAVVVESALRGARWDCVVVGGGLRHDPDLLLLFEQVVNLARRHAPGAAIAFNARPDDTYAAAARHLS